MANSVDISLDVYVSIAYIIKCGYSLNTWDVKSFVGLQNLFPSLIIFNSALVEFINKFGSCI